LKRVLDSEEGRLNRKPTSSTEPGGTGKCICLVRGELQLHTLGIVPQDLVGLQSWEELPKTLGESQFKGSNRRKEGEIVWV